MFRNVTLIRVTFRCIPTSDRTRTVSHPADTLHLRWPCTPLHAGMGSQHARRQGGTQ